MTLIVGVNTSAAIYLASDTRVTIGPKNNRTYRNDIQKTVPIGWESVVAVAGNVHMAGLLAYKLCSHPDADTGHVRLLRERVEDIVRAASDEFYRSKLYQSLPADEPVGCCLLIGGTNPTAKKKARVKDRVLGLMFAADRREQEGLRKMQEYAESASTQEGMLTVLRKLVERQQKGLAFDGALASVGIDPPVDEAGLTTLPCIDSHLFAVTVDPQAGVRVMDAEWGEGLVYGESTVKKEITPADVMASIEFGDRNEAPVRLTTEILQAAKRTGAKTVGGGVVVVIVEEKGMGVWAGRIDNLKETVDGVEPLSELVIEDVATPHHGVLPWVFIRDDDGQLKKLILFPLWHTNTGSPKASAWASRYPS